jgi:hypothetical protein
MKYAAAALLSFALLIVAIGDASAHHRGPGLYGHEGRGAWVAGRSRAGAACSIYSCPPDYVSGVPLNPEGELRNANGAP